MIAVIFLLLASISWVLIPNAPSAPHEGFITQCLCLVVATNIALFIVKSLQPKPVNWLTVDVLFTVSFTLIHFGYFFYWVTGYFGSERPLWYAGNISVPQAVCKTLAMYSLVINLFLFGYYLVANKREIAIVNEVRPGGAVAKSWGALGRLLVRTGFLCYFAFIVIVGPAVFFGSYSGTNNISSIGNVFYQIGQVLLVSGIAVGVVSRERVIPKLRQGRFSIFQIGFIDLFLVVSTLAAIGLHGDRSTLLIIGAALMVAYSEYVKPFRLSTLATFAVAIIFLLGLILIYRSGRDVDYGFSDNFNRAMVNMGNSSVCGFVAVEYGENNLSYGRKQILELLGIIPFGRRIFRYPSNVDTSTSMYLTFLIQGRVGRGVAGTGTSAFADFYFDFGLYGTAFIFFMLGVASKWIQNRARCSLGIVWPVVLVNYVSFLAICSRYSVTGGLIRYVIYSAIYVSVFCYLTGTPFKDRMGDRTLRSAILRGKLARK